MTTALTVVGRNHCVAGHGRRPPARSMHLPEGMGQLVPVLPQWWNDHIAEAWSRSRDAAITDWNLRRDRTVSTESSIVEHALAFGHGARSAFPHLVTWDAVAPQLRADWIRLGNVGAASWDHVAEIIEHEWLRAAGPGGDASPEERPPP